MSHTRKRGCTHTLYSVHGTEQIGFSSATLTGSIHFPETNFGGVIAAYQNILLSLQTDLRGMLAVASLGLVSPGAVPDGVTPVSEVWFLVFAVHKADDLFQSSLLIVAHNFYRQSFWCHPFSWCHPVRFAPR
jgi:hypothetical protein